MASQAGTAFVPIRPDFTDFHKAIDRQLQGVSPQFAKAGDDAGQAFSRSFARGMGDPFRPLSRPPSQAAAGARAGGQFADSFRRQLDAALKSLPDVKLDADATPAERRIQEIRAQLDELSGKTVGVDISDADALAKVKVLQAELDEIGARSPSVRIKVDTAAASAQLAKFTGEETAAAGAADALSGESGGVSGIAALVVALGVLSPVLVTAGAGLGGLALGAAGVLSPLLKASQATGGLQANLAQLDPQQQVAAKSLLGLQASYRRFVKALEPSVLKDFSVALGVGENVMHDLLPVSQATSKAVGTFLGQFGATLQDPQWTRFWQFMAATAPQDIAMLGKSVIDLAGTLPPLLRDLQGAATVTLQLTDDAARLAGGIIRARDASVTWQAAQEKSTKSANVLSQAWHGFAGLIGGMDKNLTNTGRFLIGMGVSSDKAGKSTADLSGAFDHNATVTNRMGIKLIAAATDVTGLMNAESKSLATQLGYSNALIGAAGDAQSMRAALKASGGQVGLQAAAQRNSFSAANAYIAQLSTVASTAFTSGRGVAAAIAAIKGGLPLLDSAKTKNRLYWQEVRTLVGWLAKLRAEKAITELIRITGTGSWSATSGVLPGQPGKHFVGRFAAGTPGAAPGLAWVGEQGPELVHFSGGEQVFSNAQSRRLAGLAGYAAGTMPGLGVWAQRATDYSAVSTANAIGDAVARAFANAAPAAGTGGPGVSRWAGAILRALAMLGQSSANLGAVEHRMAQESGGNPLAINLWDSNARAGDPSRGLMQTIGSTFARWRSFSLPDNIYNPLANIFAGLNYAIHAYPGRSLASVMLQPGGYDVGGWLMPGAQTVVNATRKPEAVLTAAQWQLVSQAVRGGDGASVEQHLHFDGLTAGAIEQHVRSALAASAVAQRRTLRTGRRR